MHCNSQDRSIIVQQSSIIELDFGDLVLKNNGASDLGSIGLVLSVDENGLGTIIVRVYHAGSIKNWYFDYVERIQ